MSLETHDDVPPTYETILAEVKAASPEVFINRNFLRISLPHGCYIEGDIEGDVIRVGFLGVNSHLEGKRTGTAARLLRRFTAEAMIRGVTSIDWDVTHYLALMTAVSVFGKDRIMITYAEGCFPIEKIYIQPAVYEQTQCDILIDLRGLDIAAFT